MPKADATRLTLEFLLGVSAFGLCTVVLLVPSLPVQVESFGWRKQLVGSVFLLLCAAGGVAALSPMKCSGTVGHQQERSMTWQAGTRGHQFAFNGHHPNCGRFSSHVASLGGHVFCAACAGLLVGALFGLVGTALYFFFNLGLERAGFQMVLFGIVGVVLGFSQLRFRGIVRTVLNVFFVLGAFLILSGADELKQSMMIDAYVIGLIVLWLVTRMMLSQWDHARICRLCPNQCEVLSSAS